MSDPDEPLERQLLGAFDQVRPKTTPRHRRHRTINSDDEQTPFSPASADERPSPHPMAVLPEPQQQHAGGQPGCSESPPADSNGADEPAPDRQTSTTRKRRRTSLIDSEDEEVEADQEARDEWQPCAASLRPGQAVTHTPTGFRVSVLRVLGKLIGGSAEPMYEVWQCQYGSVRFHSKERYGVCRCVFQMEGPSTQPKMCYMSISRQVRVPRNQLRRCSRSGKRLWWCSRCSWSIKRCAAGLTLSGLIWLWCCQYKLLPDLDHWRKGETSVSNCASNCVSSCVIKLCQQLCQLVCWFMVAACMHATEMLFMPLHATESPSRSARNDA